MNKNKRILIEKTNEGLNSPKDVEDYIRAKYNKHQSQVKHEDDLMTFVDYIEDVANDFLKGKGWHWDRKEFKFVKGEKPLFEEDKEEVREYSELENTTDSGLMVTGTSQLDNNKLRDAFEDAGLYAIWDVREGYWFLPEDEENYDQLEEQIQDILDELDLNASIEGIFNEQLNENLMHNLKKRANLLKG